MSEHVEVMPMFENGDENADRKADEKTRGCPAERDAHIHASCAWIYIIPRGKEERGERLRRPPEIVLAKFQSD